MQPEIADALVEAANLLLVGMVVVFLFLSMLIGAITLIAKISVFFPDQTALSEENQSRITANAASVSQSMSPKVVAAISAAISQHRQSH